jgi:hypothetical protein
MRTQGAGRRRFWDEGCGATKRPDERQSAEPILNDRGDVYFDDGGVPPHYRMSGPILVGSDLLLVQAAFLQRQHPSSKQVDVGASIHRSVEGFQFVDLSFGLPVAPRFQHSVPNSLQVLAYRPGKTLHRVDPRAACMRVGSVTT